MLFSEFRVVETILAVRLNKVSDEARVTRTNTGWVVSIAGDPDRMSWVQFSDSCTRSVSSPTPSDPLFP